MRHLIFLFFALWATLVHAEGYDEETEKTVYLVEQCSGDRRGSAPYISGDTFREFADFIIDETNLFLPVESMERGSAIFVRPENLAYFFTELHPQISSPYILITHNSDDSIPGEFASFLDDNKLIVWFGQNVEGVSHKKLHPLPIGIANRSWKHGNVEVFHAVQGVLGSFAKEFLLYMNFSVSNTYEHRGAKDRLSAYHQFMNESYCNRENPKPLSEYLVDLAKSKFVLSPRGNGLDCYRSWEALYMGAIPIVRSSEIDSLFENLPVIIVNEWVEITEAFLEEKYSEMDAKDFQWEKLHPEYWFKLINSYRE